MARLIAEEETFHDVIVTDIKDSYETLILKVNAMMNFFAKHCSKASYLMKVDDDVTIHLDRMLTHLNQAYHYENDIYCRLCPVCSPFRKSTDKWYISRKVWRRNTYPSYCHGSLYILGKAAVHGILEVARCHNPFPFEDVFYTGILASAANFQRIEWKGKIIAVDEATWQRTILCDGSNRPVTFAVSSFKTSSSLMEAFQHLIDFRCLSF